MSRSRIWGKVERVEPVEGVGNVEGPTGSGRWRGSGVSGWVTKGMGCQGCPKGREVNLVEKIENDGTVEEDGNAEGVERAEGIEEIEAVAKVETVGGTEKVEKIEGVGEIGRRERRVGEASGRVGRCGRERGREVRGLEWGVGEGGR